MFSYPKQQSTDLISSPMRTSKFFQEDLSPMTKQKSDISLNAEDESYSAYRKNLSANNSGTSLERYQVLSNTESKYNFTAKKNENNKNENIFNISRYKVTKENSSDTNLQYKEVKENRNNNYSEIVMNNNISHLSHISHNNQSKFSQSKLSPHSMSNTNIFKPDEIINNSPIIIHNKNIKIDNELRNNNQNEGRRPSPFQSNNQEQEEVESIEPGNRRMLLELVK